MDLVALLNLGHEEVESIFDRPERTTAERVHEQGLDPRDPETPSDPAVETRKTEAH